MTTDSIKLLAPCEVAALCRVSVKTVYRRIRSGSIPAVKFGNAPAGSADRRHWRAGRVDGRWATSAELERVRI